LLNDILFNRTLAGKTLSFNKRQGKPLQRENNHIIITSKDNSQCNSLEQAHYNLQHCMDLRLYPDHTLLLLKNEAYLVINGEEVVAKEIIAMRVSFVTEDSNC
jgi:uncharacterized protein YlzI (FlbEa/FlbD family)